MGNNSCSLNYRVVRFHIGDVFVPKLICVQSTDSYLVTVFYDHPHGRGEDAWATKVPTSQIDISEYEERFVLTLN